ncbi:MAG: hypothetical protein KYX68_13290 [Flavobacterium sp.]|nr:hypothetical protein [Flavobacterium sp.]
MNLLDRKEFVDSFFDSNDLEGNMGSVIERRRLMSEINSLLSQGIDKYEAIIELCHKNKIDFKINKKDSSTLKVSTFMDNREWSHYSVNSDAKNNISKVTGKEIFSMLCIKFNNLIIIENTLKK